MFSGTFLDVMRLMDTKQTGAEISRDNLDEKIEFLLNIPKDLQNHKVVCKLGVRIIIPLGVLTVKGGNQRDNLVWADIAIQFNELKGNSAELIGRSIQFILYKEPVRIEVPHLGGGGGSVAVIGLGQKAKQALSMMSFKSVGRLPT